MNTKMRLPSTFLITLAVTSAALGQTYTISTFAGGGLPLNSPAIAASLGYGVPSAIAGDRAGNLYFPNQHTVMRLDAATGLLTVVAGNGTTGFSGDNGPATSAQLNHPQGVALDSAGNLYIADTWNYRIRKVSGGIITTVAGSGIFGLGGDDGPAVDAQLESPSGVAMDSAGNLYIVLTFDKRIRKVSHGVITTVAGGGSSPGENIPATSAQLSDPHGIALDSTGNLYIADVGARRIREVANGVITTVAGTGASTFACDNGQATSARLSFPAALAIDPAGNLYIADSITGCVLRVSNGVVTTAAGGGTSLGDNGPAAEARFLEPSGLALDAAGSLYIADAGDNRIRKAANGVITTVAGNGTPNFSGDNGPAARAQLSTTTAVALDSHGDLYIADRDNHRVRKVSRGVITTVAGDGELGNGGDNGPATAAQLNNPGSLALDSAGNLYIADGDRTRKVSNGVITTVELDFLHIDSESVAVDSAGSLYIADREQSRVRKLSGGIETIVAGTGKAGYSGDNGPAASAQLSAPAGLAFDSAGALYIADSGNFRIRRVLNGVITTVAGNGTLGDAGNNGPATAAQLSGPQAVALDPLDNLYIADYGHSNVRKVSGGVITTIAGNRSDGLSGDNGPATAAQLEPIGIAVDSAGVVYIADYFNDRVRALTPSAPSCSASARLISQPAASGGSVSVAVQTGSSCVWAVQSLPSWITYKGNVLGSGTATITLTVAPNTGTTRSGAVSVAGIPVSVTQPGIVPAINPGGLVNAASSEAGSPVAPGSIATVYGSFLTTPSATATNLPLPNSIGGLSIQFGNGLNAPLFAVSAGQVNFQIPWELAGQAQAPLAVTVNGQVSAPQTINLAPSAPGIFSINAQGTGQGAILDTSYRLVDSANPAIAGSTVIQIYGTGLGSVSDQPPSGSPALSKPLSSTTTTPAVTIGGIPATVLFAGLAPGSVGEYQLNVLVPSGSPRGAAVPVVMRVKDATSNTVTIAVQ